MGVQSAFMIFASILASGFLGIMADEFVPEDRLGGVRPGLVISIAPQLLTWIALGAFAAGAATSALYIYLWSRYHNIDVNYVSYLPKQSWRKRSTADNSGMRR